MVVDDPFESVLAAAQAGAEWAFAELYQSYNPLLERFFAGRTRSVAEDLVADTWLGAARALSRFAGNERQFRSWLFTIAHRRLVDHWKAQNRFKSAFELDGDLSGPPVESPEATVVETLSGREAARRIAAALPADQAEIVLLRVVVGLDVEEVARITGRRPGTVRVLQHRALKKLSRDFSLEAVTE
ncbi:MAG TPA: RNA polymerase sigma factor [Acidimicrobiales bacterium]|jgi:RNA polymerase sigma-70 factor (ECF subfamily)|nr:RNA polymerase sigma factor [Acidimicrobiales bacterium]